MGFHALWFMIPTKTKTRTRTKCLKDPTYAIFLKSKGSKDIKYPYQSCGPNSRTCVLVFRHQVSCQKCQLKVCKRAGLQWIVTFVKVSHCKQTMPYWRIYFLDSIEILVQACALLLQNGLYVVNIDDHGFLSPRGPLGSPSSVRSWAGKIWINCTALQGDRKRL